MADRLAAVRAQLDRQIAHWTRAVQQLALDDIASAGAWATLEQYLGVSLRKHLSDVLDRLTAQGTALAAQQKAAVTIAEVAALRRALVHFRRQFLKTESTLDFFGDAINTRTNPRTAALLRACDTLAERSMAALLDQLDRETPPVLTYLDKGVGASILSAGRQLWDGGRTCPVAAIKVTRHNLFRPTSLIHETGHQVAHITGWAGELADAFRTRLERLPEPVSAIWASWASEIAADAFAFAHTGYASVVALHDVVADMPALVFRYVPSDPHPISYLRVMLGVAMCRRFYGDGPWDRLAEAWQLLQPLRLAPRAVAELVELSLPALPDIVAQMLDTPMSSFGGRSLAALIPPNRVSPQALERLTERIGPALYTSSHWLWSEPLRILAATGASIDVSPETRDRAFTNQEDSMLRIGGLLKAA